MSVSEEEMEALLQEMIIENTGRDQDGWYDPDLGEDVTVRTFDQAGLLTRNRGLVITTEAGEEFHLTIVRRGG